MPFIAVATVISSFGVVVYNVTQVSMRQAITPERLQGRMNSVIRFIVWGVMPLGQLTGGAIASAVDLRTAIWIGAAGVAIAWLPVTIGPWADPSARGGTAARYRGHRCLSYPRWRPGGER